MELAWPKTLPVGAQVRPHRFRGFQADSEAMVAVARMRAPTGEQTDLEQSNVS